MRTNGVIVCIGLLLGCGAPREEHAVEGREVQALLDPGALVECRSRQATDPLGDRCYSDACEATIVAETVSRDDLWPLSNLCARGMGLHDELGHEGLYNCALRACRVIAERDGRGARYLLSKGSEPFVKIAVVGLTDQAKDNILRSVDDKPVHLEEVVGVTLDRKLGLILNSTWLPRLENLSSFDDWDGLGWKVLRVFEHENDPVFLAKVIRRELEHPEGQRDRLIALLDRACGRQNPRLRRADVAAIVGSEVERCVDDPTARLCACIRAADRAP